MNRIITIGREFGSGGHEIGMRLASRLGIPFYDKEIITMAAEQGGIDEALIRQNEERMPRTLVGRMGFASLSYNPTFSDTIFLHQSAAVKKLAKDGPCVIVGRCADFVLREENPVNVFIAASLPYKMRRKRSMAPEKADYTDEQFMKYISDTDERRRKYYEHYTRQKWGHIENYHLCVHSDLVDVEGAVNTIVAYLENIRE